MISLLHAYVAIVAALTDCRQSQTLLLFMVCHKSALLAQACPTMMKHLPSTCEVQTTGGGSKLWPTYQKTVHFGYSLKLHIRSVHTRYISQQWVKSRCWLCVVDSRVYSEYHEAVTELTISHSLPLSEEGGPTTLLVACPSSTALTRWANVREQTVSLTFFSTGAAWTTISVLESPPRITIKACTFPVSRPLTWFWVNGWCWIVKVLYLTISVAPVLWLIGSPWNVDPWISTMSFYIL